VGFVEPIKFQWATQSDGRRRKQASQRGMPLNRDKFRELIIRSALKAAGLPETFRTYDIRHSHASLLIEQGANLLAISQRMGHTDPALTLRVYGHLFAGAQEELTRRLDELRWSVPPKGATGEVVPLVAANGRPGAGPGRIRSEPRAR